MREIEPLPPSRSIDPEYTLYLEAPCGLCGEQECEARSKCSHYFHVKCLKEHYLEHPIACPQEGCQEPSFQPWFFLCVRCHNKTRKVTVSSQENAKKIKQYYCVECRVRIDHEEKRKSCWRRCCK